MKIGVIGSGVVAQSLGAGFLKHGHDVVLGTRDAAKLKEWAAKHSKGRVENVETAAKLGEMLVLAVKGSAATDALRSAGLPTAGSRNRHDQSDCGPAAGQWRTQVYHESRRIAVRTTAARISAQPGEGVQFCRLWADDQSAIQRRQADDVHLRQRRIREEDRTRVFDQFGWETADASGAPSRRARSSRFVYSGASRG
jgi:hypothetical protein